jgi:hypothetical protein
MRCVSRTPLSTRPLRTVPHLPRLLPALHALFQEVEDDDDAGSAAAGGGGALAGAALLMPVD